MHALRQIVAATALSLLAASSFASATVFNTAAAFQAQLQPGAYTESFTGMSNPPFGPVPFSGGGYAYSASAPADIYLAGGFLGANLDNQALTVAFTSGNVTAFGANFFMTDITDAFQAVSVTLTLSDGTVETFTPTSVADSFRGFVSSGAAFTSLVISAGGAGNYSGLDNLTVGSRIPEPTSLALVGLAMAGVFVSRRRAA